MNKDEVLWFNIASRINNNEAYKNLTYSEKLALINKIYFKIKSKLKPKCQGKK